jgi:hypothetical protein
MALHGNGLNGSMARAMIEGEKEESLAAAVSALQVYPLTMFPPLCSQR